MRKPYPNELYHYGVPGAKWGYSYGRKNGNRVAEGPDIDPNDPYRRLFESAATAKYRNQLAKRRRAEKFESEKSRAAQTTADYKSQLARRKAAEVRERGNLMGVNKLNPAQRSLATSVEGQRQAMADRIAKRIAEQDAEYAKNTPLHEKIANGLSTVGKNIGKAANDTMDKVAKSKVGKTVGSAIDVVKGNPSKVYTMKPGESTSEFKARMKKDQDEITREKVKKLKDNVDDLTAPVRDTAKKVVNNPTVKKVTKATTDAAKKAAKATSDTAKKAAKVASDTANKVGKAASDTAKKAAKAASDTANKVGKAASKTVSDINDFVSKVTTGKTATQRKAEANARTEAVRKAFDAEQKREQEKNKQKRKDDMATFVQDLINKLDSGKKKKR